MLFSRKYIVGHFFVVIIVTTCFFLSYWQFSRLSERKELNTRIEARMLQPQAELSSIVVPTDSSVVIKNNEYRRVSVEGTYDESGQVLISGRTQDGEPGYNVITPLVTDQEHNKIDQYVVYINRGWIPQPLGDALANGSVDGEDIAPPQGYETSRTIVGLVRKNESKQFLNTAKQVEKQKAITTRISTELLLKISGARNKDVLYPLWIQKQYETIDGKKVETNDNAPVDYPTTLARPELTERNHFSYALQWVLFGFVAMITWGVICKAAVIRSRKVITK
ncbi:MAG TPA: SURF1 family protein [Acidimicrobiia bacterium]|jgi:cytochrome oxidase assembly protein ShyY1|nr:SURF1 family protein [Acidimicrobiia bacterium]